MCIATFIFHFDNPFFESLNLTRRLVTCTLVGRSVIIQRYSLSLSLSLSHSFKRSGERHVEKSSRECESKMPRGHWKYTWVLGAVPCHWDGRSLNSNQRRRVFRQNTRKFKKSKKFVYFLNDLEKKLIILIQFQNRITLKFQFPNEVLQFSFESQTPAKHRSTDKKAKIAFWSWIYETFNFIKISVVFIFLFFIIITSSHI